MTLKDRLLRGIESEQLILVGFGTHLLICAFFLGWETYVTGAGRFLWPYLWPPIFLAAFVACALYHHDRSSRFLCKLSGSLALLAYTSRAFIVGQQMAANGVNAKFTVGVATWALIAGAVEVLWVRVVYPRTT